MPAPYECPACSKVFLLYTEYDQHRAAVHGRHADGTLVTSSDAAILLAARELSAFLAARPRCVACGGAGEHGPACPVEKLRKAVHDEL